MTKFVLSLFIVLAFVSAPFAYAHDLATDGEVGAVMHIEPEDDPIAGAPSTLIFEFKDSKQVFDTTKYGITLAIAAGSTTLATTTLIAEGADAAASYSYTFPNEGTYTITVTGTPVAAAPAFILTYEAQAQAGTPAVATSTNKIAKLFGVHGGHVLITLLLIIILVYVVVSEKRKEKKAARTHTSTEGPKNSE